MNILRVISVLYDGITNSNHLIRPLILLDVVSCHISNILVFSLIFKMVDQGEEAVLMLARISS
jgi:hypothetical protein